MSLHATLLGRKNELLGFVDKDKKRIETLKKEIEINENSIKSNSKEIAEIDKVMDIKG